MYESMEALAKIVTGKNTDLYGRKPLISKLALADEFQKMLRQYITYAN